MDVRKGFEEWYNKRPRCFAEHQSKNSMEAGFTGGVEFCERKLQTQIALLMEKNELSKEVKEILINLLVLE